MNKNNEKIIKFTERLIRDHDFIFIKNIYKKYPQAEVYLVGGIIRDLLLGRKSKDYDFVVRNIEAKKLSELLGKLGDVNLVGKNFGVLKFLPKKSKIKEEIDIALPRTEFSTGHGYKEFDIQSDIGLSIEEDLSRRDFTINAMAINIKNNILVDPFGGIEDLNKKIIKAVGDAEARFDEDYSRILRAIRFATQLNFRIEKNTWLYIKKLASRITDVDKKTGDAIVPYEIISSEFIKTLNADPVKMLDMYEKSGLLSLVLPEIEAMKGVKQPDIYHAEGDVYVHTKLCLSKLKTGDPIELKLAVLLHDVGKPPTQRTPEKDGVDRIRFDEHPEVGADMARKICNRLRLPKKFINHVVWLVKNHMLFVHGKVEDMKTSTIKKYFIDDVSRGNNLLELYRIDMSSSENKFIEENTKRYEQVKDYIEEMREAFQKAKVETFRHVLSGEDVIKYFDIEPGPEVGKYLALADEYIFNYITKKKREPSKRKILKKISRMP